MIVVLSLMDLKKVVEQAEANIKKDETYWSKRIVFGGNEDYVSVYQRSRHGDAPVAELYFKKRNKKRMLMK
jgi:hypothetical protein